MTQNHSFACLILSLLLVLFSCAKEPPIFELTTSVVPANAGNIDLSEGLFEEGTLITLVATPADNFSFLTWSGDVENDQPIIEVLMNSDKIITANFVLQDADNDGVADYLDECPNTDMGLIVNDVGCALNQLDSDDDGVMDDMDECPNTDMGLIVNDVGCALNQLDSDDDGVMDDMDQCPSTPLGLEVDDKGCLMNNPIYLKDNGVTLAAYGWAEIGAIGFYDGKYYQIVDNESIRTVFLGDEPVNVVTTKVTNMSGVLANSDYRRGEISSWDVSNVDNMRGMFSGITTENLLSDDVSFWDVSNVLDMSAMFEASFACLNVSKWDVSKVRNMSYMFSGLGCAGGNLENWDVSNVQDMSFMFFNGSARSGITVWDVSNVRNMEGMFAENTSFNQDISSWDVSSVENMSWMFLNATSYGQFNRDLSSWNVDKVTRCISFCGSCESWVLPKPNFTNCSF
jgi:surface protein